MDRISQIIGGITLTCSILSLVRWRKIEAPFLRTFGLELDQDVPKEIAGGALVGAAVISGVFATEWLMGLVQVDGLLPPTQSSIAAPAQLLILAFAEEVVYGGIILNTLLVRLPRPLAVALTAAIFSFGHSDNPHASAISVASNVLDGIIYALAFAATGRIWLPLGVHWAWNTFQGPIFGFPVSGHMFGGIVQQEVVDDNTFLTGGAYGPEAGVIGLVGRLIIILAVLQWGKTMPRTQTPQSTYAAT
jgi:uncharacterized protein